MRNRLFGENDHDKIFIATLHQKMQEVMLKYQETQTLFAIVNQNEIELLYKPNSLKTVNDYLQILEGIRTTIIESIEKNTHEPNEKLCRNSMLSVVEDVVGSIRDNQTIIADAKNRLKQASGKIPEVKKLVNEVLDLNTADLDLFSHKVQRLQKEVEVVTITNRTYGKDVTRLEEMETSISQVLQDLPKDNIRMHHLNKEQFEIDRKVRKGQFVIARSVFCDAAIQLLIANNAMLKAGLPRRKKRSSQ